MRTSAPLAPLRFKRGFPGTVAPLALLRSRGGCGESTLRLGRARFGASLFCESVFDCLHDLPDIDLRSGMFFGVARLVFARVCSVVCTTWPSCFVASVCWLVARLARLGFL